MAKLELKIYGENDEIVKEYKTNRVRYGVLLQAIKLNDEMDDKNVGKQMSAISDIMKRVFVGITDEDLACADVTDIFNTFTQIVNFTSEIEGNVDSKN